MFSEEDQCPDLHKLGMVPTLNVVRPWPCQHHDHGQPSHYPWLSMASGFSTHFNFFDELLHIGSVAVPQATPSFFTNHTSPISLYLVGSSGCLLLAFFVLNIICCQLHSSFVITNIILLYITIMNNNLVLFISALYFEVPAANCPSRTLISTHFSNSRHSSSF